MFLFLAGLFAALLCVINLLPDTALWIHLASKPLLHGVSNFKLNFWVLTSLLICLLAFFSKDASGLHRRWRPVFWISTITGLAAGALSFAIAAMRLGVPWERYSFHFQEGLHTINYYAHTHTSKVAMDLLVDTLGLGRMRSVYDTAWPLREFVPVGLAWVILASFLISWLSLLVMSAGVLRSFEKRLQPLAFAIYSLAGVHLVKCLIDGGPLSYDLPPSALALFYLLRHAGDAKALAEDLRRRRLLNSLLIILFLVVHLAIAQENIFLQAVIGIAFFGAVYHLLFLGMAPRTGSPLKRWGAGLLLGCFIAFYWYQHTGNDAKHLLEPVGSRHKVLQYRGLEIHDRTHEVLGRSMLEAYRLLGENPIRNHSVVVLGQGDPQVTGMIFMLKSFAGAEVVQLPENASVKIRNIVPDKTRENTYLLDLSFDPASFPTLWRIGPTIIDQNNKYAVFTYLDNYLRQAGIRAYVMTPYYFVDLAAGQTLSTD